jgi:hypothetical protein
MCECQKKCQNCCEHKNLTYFKETNTVQCTDCQKIFMNYQPIYNSVVSKNPLKCEIKIEKLFPTYDQFGYFLGYYPSIFLA